MLDRMMRKVSDNLDDILSYDEFMTEDAEHLVISYGSTARAAKSAVKTLRAEGIKAGLFRPITVWPYPAERTVELAKQVKTVTVAEMNLGQLKLEVERVVGGEAPVQLSGKANGEVLTPDEIIAKVKEAL
jgi:2-oxoglutarate ferredoxin oxidoreductase subunit alpha